MNKDYTTYFVSILYSIELFVQEWFSWRIVQFTSHLQRQNRSHHSTSHANVPVISVTNVDGSPAVPEGTVIALENLAHEFEELANTCLLVLHLEVVFDI